MGLASRIIRTFGVMGGSYLMASAAVSRVRPSWALKRQKLTVKGWLRPFYIRPGTSDRVVVKQVIINAEYDCRSQRHIEALQKLYETILERNLTPLIIDCGANIGLASLWYAHMFPKAHIIAVEPQGDNCALLRINSRYYPNITVIQGAVSSCESAMTLSNVGNEPWSWETTLCDSGDIPTYTIENLLAKIPNTQCMIVKIDIEGHETELFRTNVEWVKSVPVIVFEAHDWLFDAGGTFHAVASVLTKQPRDYIQQGENMFAFSHTMLSAGRG